MKDEKNKSKWFREAGVGMFIHACIRRSDAANG